MELELDGNYLIESDPHCWVLKKKIKPKKPGSKPYWKPDGFFIDLISLLAYWGDEKMKVNGRVRVEKLSSLVEAYRREIEAIGARLEKQIETELKKQEGKKCRRKKRGV